MKHAAKIAVLLTAVMMLASCGEEANKPAAQANGGNADNNSVTTTTAEGNANPFNNIFPGDQGGETAETGNNGGENPDYTTEDYSYTDDETTTTTTAPEETTTTTTTEAPKPSAGDGLVTRYNYSNFVQYKYGKVLLRESGYRDRNYTETLYIADMTGKISLEMNKPEKAYSYWSILKNGNLLNYSNQRENFKEYTAYGDKVTIYNAVGDILMSPDKSGFEYLIMNTEDYFLVTKNDTGFSGDTHYIGVLNNDGEWVKELTATTEDLYLNERSYNYWSRVKGENGSNYAVTNLTKGGIALVDLSKGEIVFKTDEKYNNDNKNRFNGVDDYEWYLEDKTLYALVRYSYSSGGKYNIETGEFTSWKEFSGIDKTTFSNGNKNFDIKSYFNGYYYAGYTGYDKSTKENIENYYIMDKEFNNLVPLNGYKIYSNDCLGYADGNAVFLAYGKDSGVYLCVVDAEGKLAFEPIKLSGENSVSFQYFRIFDDRVVYIPYYGDEKTINTIDWTGKTTSQKFEGYFQYYDGENDVCCVERDNELWFFGTDGTTKLQVTKLPEQQDY